MLPKIWVGVASVNGSDAPMIDYNRKSIGWASNRRQSIVFSYNRLSKKIKILVSVQMLSLTKWLMKATMSKKMNYFLYNNT